MKRGILAAGLSIFLLTGCGTSVPAAARQVSTQTIGIAKGDQAPQFSLPSLKGNGTISLQKQMGDKRYILVNAWASWCPPCQQEAPDLESISKSFKKDLQVIGVNMSTSDPNRQQVENFVSKYHLQFPVAVDPKGTFAKSYQIVALPTSFLLSPEGQVLAVHQGPITAAWVKEHMGAQSGGG